MPFDSARHSAVVEALARLRESGFALALSAFGRDGDGGFGVVTEEGVRVVDRISSKGMAFGDGQVVRALDITGGVRTWARSAQFVIYDELGTVRCERIEGVGDVHDVLHDANGWMFVSTADDSIRRWTPGVADSIETVYASGHGCDFTHVNCITVVDARLVATAFASPDGWSWRTNLRKMRKARGRLFDASTGEVLVDRLSRPHSPRRWNRWWIITEAGDHSLLMVDDVGERVSIDVGGFARGLHLLGDLAFVAISPPRPSLNAVAVDALHPETGLARVIVVDLHARNVIDRLELPFAEVYDIVALPLTAVDVIIAVSHDVQAQLGAVGVDDAGGPRGLVMGDPIESDERRCAIQADPPEWVWAGSTFEVPVLVTNLGGVGLGSSGGHRVLAGWWWGEAPDGLRGGTGLGAPLGPGGTGEIRCQVDAPTRSGVHRLHLGLIQEGVGWFEGSASFEVEIRPRSGG